MAEYFRDLDGELDAPASAYIFDLSDLYDDDREDANAEANSRQSDSSQSISATDDVFELDESVGSADPDGRVIRYVGGDQLLGVPCRDDIVAATNNGVSARLRSHLDAGRPVFFMPNDIEETTEYVGGQPQYLLRIFGVLMDGSKASVALAGINVFFDVQVPAASARAAHFGPYLISLLADADAHPTHTEIVEAYPERGYHITPLRFVRVYLATMHLRKKAIMAARSAGLITKSDDRSCYYRKVARELGLPLSAWAVLSDYEYETGYSAASPLCAHVFRVPVAAYKPLVDTMGPRVARDAATRTRDGTPLLARDRTLVATWDIETYSDSPQGDLPIASREGDRAFMICLTAHWKDDSEPLVVDGRPVQICIVDVETAPAAGWTTVVCGSPLNVLKAFALCWRALAPDIVCGFNDSEYDWPFIVGKASALGILGWMWSAMTASPRRSVTNEGVYRWNYADKKKIKISAEEVFFSSYLKVPGCIPVDARVVYKKLYPKSETPKAGSLKFYLEISGLPGKADLPIQRMWQYYRAALAESNATTAEHMRHVAHYCVIDALRCQQLLVRRNVINDYREVSTLAFVSLFDSHYYAGGMKVCNLLGAYAARRNMLVSMIPASDPESGKYLGGFVFQPEKGLVPDPERHTALDVAAANLRRLTSQLEACGTAATPESLAKAQTLIGEIHTTASGLLGDRAAAEAALGEAKRQLDSAFRAMAADRPVTGLDFSSLYPSLIMTYNLSPEKILYSAAEVEAVQAAGKRVHKIDFIFNGRRIEAWSVRHEGVEEDIGLYPRVLIDLFNKRAEVKAVLATHGAVKEIIELINARAQKDLAAVHVASGVELTPSALLGAAESLLEEAAVELARTEAALAPGAPPPKISPGSTAAEELAELKRLGRNARELCDGIRRLRAAAETAVSDGKTYADAFSEELRREYARASFDWTCANTKQNAIKVYMNTFYGEAGNSLSPFFELALAGGVTSAGQYNIKMVAEFVIGRGFRIKYGDSVTGDTALVIRLAGIPQTARIDELVPDGGWTPYGDKEAAVVPNLEIWQDGGFTPVSRVIRHACHKPVTRVLTHTGVVDCTADHSLLRPDGAKVSPVDVNVGDALLHADDEDLVLEFEARSAHEDSVTEREAFAMGLFAADGSCGRYEYAGGAVKHSWAINNLDLTLLQEAADHLPFPSRILDTVGSSGVYKLVPVGDIKGPTLRYRQMFYNAHREKRIPTAILGAEQAIIAEFWRGFYAGDGDRTQQLLQTNWRIDQKGKEMCTGLWLLGRRLGWQVSLNDRTDKPDVFRMTFSSVQGRKRPLTNIKKKRQLKTVPEFVYDLETESHHFHVGPGDLVVHNTDSLYLQAPEIVFADCDAEYAAGRLTREEYWSAQVRITIRALNQIRDEVNAMLRRDNGTGYLKMAYEEVLFPALFTGKKKYIGIPHLNEVNFRPKKLFVRGIEVVKQGQPGLAREIGYRIMWACMALDNDRSVGRIVEDVLRDAVVNGSQWNFEHFVKSDAWKPHKDNKAVHRFIARMRARQTAENAAPTGAGRLYELPEPGERFRYVIVRAGAGFSLRGLKASPKKGDRMEFAHVARALSLDVDVAYYMASYVVGLCARFINGEARFTPPNAAALGDAKVDEMSQKAAKKYLEAYVTGLSVGADTAMLRRRGYAYRRAFGAAASEAQAALAARVGPAAAQVLHSQWLDFELFGDESEDDADGDSVNKTIQTLWDSAAAYSHTMAEREGDTWCVALGRALGIEPNGSDSRPASPDIADTATAASAKPTAVALYQTTERPNVVGRRRPPGAVFAAYLSSAMARIEAEIREGMVVALPAVSEVALRYEADLSRLVHRLRLDEHAAHPDIGAVANAADAELVSSGFTLSVTEADRATLLAFRELWFRAVGVSLCRTRGTKFAAHLASLKAKRLGAAVAPPAAQRSQIIASAAAKMRVSGELDPLSML